MSTFVSLLEVLEFRGSSLDEDEVWTILLTAAKTITSISNTGPANLCGIISPGSILMSLSGGVAFKTCSLSENVASFTSPEMIAPAYSFSKECVEKMLVYSLGMTLYWTVDYQLPQNQPVRLSDNLNSLLLSMCEEESARRPNLLVVLQHCEHHQKSCSLPPPDRVIQQLVQDVLQHQNTGPEFVRALEEPFITLELPSSIVKGKSSSKQRDVRVITPNGQTVLVKCDVKSRGGDVFDMIIAHSKMVEHFYFGLAYIDNNNEFFFLDDGTEISKIAPESWKKVPMSTFVLHMRIKFFVSDISLLLHKLTRHQYYLQLRRDILEDRLPCTEETSLFLSALALQAEFGDILPEMYGKQYYQPEHYIHKSILEKMAMPCLKQELLQLHANNANMTAEESELEFLKAVQQLPEYGILFHRATCLKTPSAGELLLGVCAKGIVVYEVKNTTHTMSLRFYWRETVHIFAAKRKFVIVSSISKKKHTFLMGRSRIARYLCSLCTAQHKFHMEMSSRQLSWSLVSEDSNLQCDVSNPQTHTSMRVSCLPGTTGDAHHDSMSKLCDDIASRIETRIRQQRDFLEHCNALTRDPQEGTGSSKRSSVVPSVPSFLRDTLTSPCAPAREILSITLTKDVKFGLGIVIVGEDNASGLDLVIFIASIVPGGPANRDGRIKPGSRLISLNQTSLEGVPFNQAADIIQSCPNQVELIISQTKGSQAGDGLDELVMVMMIPKTGRRLHVPEVHVLSVQTDLIRRNNLATI